MTSPHLLDVRERISVDGHPISADHFDDLYEQIAPMVEMVDAQSIDGVRMTAFEVYTALGFAAFADAPVDVAVVEVGLGGTWDATNVADATVAVVCPVDLDHMHLLGSTIAEIAGEKAGIIKPGCTAVLAAQRPEAAAVLLDRCAQVGATPVLEGVDFGVLDRAGAVGGQMVRLQTASGPLGDLHLPLFGAHMAENAAVALAAVEHFLGGNGLDGGIINDAFADVVAPARLEVLRRSPTVLLDTAHNPHAARALVDAVEENFGFPRLVGVVSMMADKNIDDVLTVFSEAMTDVVVTRVSSTDRGLDIDELADRAAGVFGADRVETAANYSEAVDLAMRIADEAGPAAGVLIAGSVIGAGEARALFVSPEREAARDQMVTVGIGDPADPYDRTTTGRSARDAPRRRANPMIRVLSLQLLFDVIVFGLAYPGMVIVSDVTPVAGGRRRRRRRAARDPLRRHPEARDRLAAGLGGAARGDPARPVDADDVPRRRDFRPHLGDELRARTPPRACR